MCLSRLMAIQPSLRFASGPHSPGTPARASTRAVLRLVEPDGGFSSQPPQIKKATRCGGFFNWWRRRESNPRPQVLYSQFYILSLLFNLTCASANRQADDRRVTYCLTLGKVTLLSAILVNGSAVCCQTRP